MSENLVERADALLKSRGYEHKNGTHGKPFFYQSRRGSAEIHPALDAVEIWEPIDALPALLSTPTLSLSVSQVEAVVKELQPQADMSPAFKRGYFVAINNVLFAVRHLSSTEKDAAANGRAPTLTEFARDCAAGKYDEEATEE